MMMQQPEDIFSMDHSLNLTSKSTSRAKRYAPYNTTTNNNGEGKRKRSRSKKHKKVGASDPAENLPGYIFNI